MTSFLSSIDDIQSALKQGLAYPADFLRQFLDIQRLDENSLQCWVETRKETIEQETRRRNVLPLDGLVVGIKDNIATSEFPTLMGTSHWIGTQGGFDARVVYSLRSNGAIIGGKTVCSEFAVHQRTRTLNPRYPDCEPGTSSSGSAAAVAGGQVSVALGTQTAGSIIKPASYCGVIGFKPTFGEIPRTGILKTTELFDTVGFIGRRIADICSVYQAVQVKGSNYPLHEGNRKAAKDGFFTSLLIFSGDSIDEPSEYLLKEFNSFCELMGKTLHLTIEKIEIPIHLKEVRNAFERVYAKDLSYFLKDHKLENQISSELHEMFVFGESLSLDEYQQCLRRIGEWRTFMREIKGSPLILSLATSQSSPRKGLPDKIDGNLLITSAGNPQLTIPVLRDEYGKLVGVSIAGKKFTDLRILNIAQEFFPIDALSVSDFGSN